MSRPGIFQRIEPDMLPAPGLLKAANFLTGQMIFAEGEFGDRLYVIDSGKVKISQRVGAGRKHLQAVLGPSEMFGELAVFDPGPRTSSATAITKVRTVTMDRAGLRWWIAEHPEMGEQLLRVLARRLRRTIENWADVIFTDMPGRLAKLLLQLAQQFGSQRDGVTHVSHDLTQEELAQLVGTSRENVNKALTDFSRRGWIRLQGKTLLILDSEHLIRRAR